jgi:hypothetical protein
VLNRTAAILALAALFAFRVFYGLTMPFWFEDERQVYLVGLQSFVRGEWPYFGADVVWTGAQLPGALLGWLTRLPLAIWSAPESPIVFLNVLSFSALGLLAWYLSRRLPSVPTWLIWLSLLTLPWTLNFSTHVVNPSYVLAAGAVFFVGFFEATPVLTHRIVRSSLAWSMMGAGLLAMVQLHMSWVLLVPYVVAAMASLVLAAKDARGRVGALARAAAALVAGAAIPASLLVPTIVKYGWGAGGVEDAIVLRAQSPFAIVTNLARVLSFASFEINRFLGLSTAERVLALSRQPVMIAAAIPVAIAGVVQPAWMAVSAFRASAPGEANPGDWTRVRLLVLATVALITGSYYFSIRGPQAHSFYVVFPVSALFAFTCWSERARARGGRLRGLERVAAVVLAAGIVFHVLLALDRLPRQSLYVDRALVAAALDDRNDRYLGDRRDTANATRDRVPRPSDPVDPEVYRSAGASSELQLISARWRPVAGRFSSFTVTVLNRSRVGWVDIRFAAKYLDSSGATLATREVVVKQILQPGESRTWSDVADGRVPEGAAQGEIAIVGAEKVIPRRVTKEN